MYVKLNLVFEFEENAKLFSKLEELGPIPKYPLNKQASKPRLKVLLTHGHCLSEVK